MATYCAMFVNFIRLVDLHELVGSYGHMYVFHAVCLITSMICDACLLPNVTHIVELLAVILRHI